MALLLLLAALATAATACGGNDGDAGAAAATATAAADHEWKKVVPGGDCECADGSEFAFWERRADPTRVVFFLDGGGACYDAETCAFTGLGTGGEANYDWSIYGEDPSQEHGIFDFTRGDNPFGEYSFIYLPSCCRGGLEGGLEDPGGSDGDPGSIRRDWLAARSCAAGRL